MNTLFKKQFCMHACALIISFVLLGAGLTKAFSTFFINQKQETLVQQGGKIAKAFRQAYFFGGKYSIDTLQKEVKVLEQYLDASFIFADNYNYIIFTSSDIDHDWRGKKLDTSNQIKDKGGLFYKIQGNMGGIFSETMLTIGYPLLIGNVQIGIIYINTPVTDLIFTVEKAYKIIILFTVFAIMVAFILVYIFSKKISLPLIEICKAAKIMADGDFEKRIYLDSEDEIGQLANVLNEMSKKINGQEKRRREFISNISHDIRSPLTSMKGFLQALIDGTIPDDKREKYLNIVLEETERLTRLSNNILNINRLEDINNQVEYVKFNINELIRNIIISFESRLVSKKLNINACFEIEQIFVTADLEKVERIVYNLIDNAIKFTEDNKNIFISTKIKGEKVFVAVKDEGRGIPKEVQARVFERFYKVDESRGEDKKGSGLGLSIVKEFIISQGETISLQSEVNKGSEFIFSLKLAD